MKNVVLMVVLQYYCWLLVEKFGLLCYFFMESVVLVVVLLCCCWLLVENKRLLFLCLLFVLGCGGWSKSWSFMWFLVKMKFF